LIKIKINFNLINKQSTSLKNEAYAAN